MTLAAVLFDMDGTLIDSEPMHSEATDTVLKAVGCVAPPEIGGLMTGMSGFDCHALLVERAGLALSFDDYVAAKYAAFLKTASSLRLRPGAAAVLQGLERQGIAFAIVSNSDRMLMDASLAAVGLARPGLITVSRNDVRDGKPHAEPYLRAAYLLGVDPAHCAVVEDSLPGAAAGLAAGMAVIGWPEPHRGDLAFPAGTTLAAPHDLLSTLDALIADRAAELAFRP
ncbi:HAD family phosphatase [Rhizobium sp. CC-YZS058]|uniref:HAD family hydrolase n=1 Tax=Rhizobium sp. CC-YZS058 TaxID=3042153 RepID=UPI002B060533|nr:HAD family phosphatase [Rhizobium sp. CC-YZS058]MEA3533900.1 HAD family phosphatase [Rhizobium sp. CC-YZS058]